MPKSVKSRPEGDSRETARDFIAFRTNLGPGQTADMQYAVEGGPELIIHCTRCGGGDRFRADLVFEDGRATRSGLQLVAGWRAKHRNCERREKRAANKAVQQRIVFEDGLV